MGFTIPSARRKRIEQLLGYLADTSNYAKWYNGNRAEDFKACFDIESKWCWKYADLVLKCLARKKGELEYGECHHIVPRTFYGKRKDDVTICKGNIVTFTFAEHVFAHFCLAMCALEWFSMNMAVAFAMMYGYRGKVTKMVMPEEAVLVDGLPEMEVRRICSMNPNGSRIDEEGRTHYFEDPIQAVKESSAARYKRLRPVIREQQKAKYAANRDEICKRARDDYAANKGGRRDKAIINANKYRQENPEKVSACKHKYYEEHADVIKNNVREWEKKNSERVKENHRRWRTENREKANALSKQWKHDNRERYLTSEKSWRERKIAAGYRIRLDPETGKRHWMFVGIPQGPRVIRKPIRPVNQYDLDGNFIASYASMTEASSTTGIDISYISYVCSGQRKTTCGFVFKYCDT